MNCTLKRWLIIHESNSSLLEAHRCAKDLKSDALVFIAGGNSSIKAITYSTQGLQMMPASYFMKLKMYFSLSGLLYGRLCFFF